MRKCLIVSFVALGLVSCSSAERQRTLADIGAYVGAPAHPDGSLSKDAAGLPIYDGVPDYDPIEVAAAAAKGAASSATTTGPYGLALYLAGGLGAAALGWYKRKFLVDTAKKMTGAVGAFGKPIGGGDSSATSSAPGGFPDASATGGPGGAGGAGGIGGTGGAGSVGIPGAPGQPGGAGGPGGVGGQIGVN